MKALTIRNVEPRLARALEREKTRRGTSLNETVLDLLRQATGVDAATRSNGLCRLAGSWSGEHLAEFERNTEEFERIDPEQWS